MHLPATPCNSVFRISQGLTVSNNPARTSLRISFIIRISTGGHIYQVYRLSNSPGSTTFFSLPKKHRLYVLVADSTRKYSLTDQGTYFHAEARSRVLFFDMGLSTNVILSPGSVPLVPWKGSRPTLRRSLIEHDTGRLQWPPRASGASESLRTSNILERHSIDDETGAASDSNTPDNYSAKALEISVFGSQVNEAFL